MPEERVIEVEFLDEDLQSIRRLFDTEQAEENDLLDVFSAGLEQFRHDEELWGELRDRADPAAEAEKQELKRRETLAHLISMRSRTIRSEIQMHDLDSRVRLLETTHADMTQRAQLLRRSIARLRGRIARLEQILGRGASPPETRPSSLRTRLIRLFTRRHD